MHVQAAFGAKGEEAELVHGGSAWRCGEIALRQVLDPANAAWVANTFSALQVPGVRVAHPLRSSDGRWVVGGWSAMRYLDGSVQPHYDQVVAASLRLHQVTAHLQKPRFLDDRQDAFSVADRAAWGEQRVVLDPALGGRLFEVLLSSCREITAIPQVVHGDLFGTVLFDDEQQAGITDFTPYWRPAEWAAAVVVVDALAWGGGDPQLLRRWAHLPNWPQMLLRALLFRLAGHALHPSSTPQSLGGLETAVHTVTASF